MLPWAIALAAAALPPGAFLVSHSAIFSVRTVDVSGTSHLTRADVIRLSGLSAGTNVLWLRSGEIVRRLETSPWVVSATVGRSLPSTVRISIRERRPASEVEVGSTWLVVASDGTVLASAARDPGLPALPVAGSLTLGERSPRLAASAAVVGHMGRWVRSMVADVRSVPGSGLELRLNSGALVLFGPATQIGLKDRVLAGILGWASERHRTVKLVDVTAPLAPAAHFGPSRPA